MHGGGICEGRREREKEEKTKLEFETQRDIHIYILSGVILEDDSPSPPYVCKKNELEKLFCIIVCIRIFFLVNNTPWPCLSKKM